MESNVKSVISTKEIKNKKLFAHSLILTKHENQKLREAI